jgi:thiamine-phosphate pyrophosphorylase
MPVNPIDFSLYLITDRKLFSSSENLMMAVEEGLSAGVKAVQLREKDLSTRELLNLAYAFRELTAHFNAKLFINDRLDVAMSVGADGVHLGQSGIPANAIRKVLGDKMLIGCSTHSFAEASEAEKLGADFITFGPLFKTPSKLQYGEPVGLEALREVTKRIKIPVFGIGGIKTEEIDEVISAGASGIAVISGVLCGADKAVAARQYLKRISVKVGENYDKD